LVVYGRLKLLMQGTQKGVGVQYLSSFGSWLTFLVSFALSFICWYNRAPSNILLNINCIFLLFHQKLS
jgi:hypothetical protein